MKNDSPAQTSPGEPVAGRNPAKRGWIAAVAVAALAGGLIAYKELGARPGSMPSSAPVASASGEPVRPNGGTVILFADPGEAEASCGCGQIIRLVRGAGMRGVSIREVAPGSDTALEREYHVTVAPTVLILDSSGRVIARHEGEAHETIDAIRTGLDGLAKAGP